MRELIQFAATAVADPETDGAPLRITARLAPFGETVEYRDGLLEFAEDSLTYPDTIPLTVDHGWAVADRIGIMERHANTDGAAYATFVLVDTQAARDVYAQLALGALTDVSVGVEVLDPDAGTRPMRGRVDHVSIVPHGRFGDAEKPSRVLQVHDGRNPTMPEPTTNEHTEQLETLEAEVVALSEMVDDLRETRVMDEPPAFASLGEWAIAMHSKDPEQLRLAELALAVDTTTTAAGVVPDYLSQEYLSIIAGSRPFVASIPSDPIGGAGMAVVYPENTQKPAVGLQAVEGTEVASQALTIATKSIDLRTYAGANRVPQQLIERSSPAFVNILFRELSGQYAQVTEAAAILAAVTAADGTAILADLSTDAATTFAAFNVASSAVLAGVRRPADTVWLASDRWGQLNSLVDADGRPLLVFGANGPMNAQGQSAFTTEVAQYHGWTVRLCPDAAAGTCLIGDSTSAASLEMNPAQLQALQVGTLATDFGIWGLFAEVVKYADGFYTLTAA